MGAGKTWWAREVVAPYLADGVPVLAPTHRTGLGESQTAAPGPPPLAPIAACRVRACAGTACAPPAPWRSALANGWAPMAAAPWWCSMRSPRGCRPETMATAAQLLRAARLVVAMDAQLSGPVLRLLEALTGETAYLIGNAHQPMAGRPVLVPQGLTARTAAEQGRARVLELAKARRRAFVITSAQQAHAKGAAANLRPP